ncbi:beta-agarase [Dyella terrae]|uniref:Beta-agarase n=3 Tax=Rhodanobacteraceae TaxID=1775411 RepID=A0A4R0YJQ8_9GAMM|nr:MULTISPECIES: beta-agarase [Dyella]TBR37311.1 beta-agarase [Dyella terrae]TCI08712.1 beta-agarase [Dyella soli]
MQRFATGLCLALCLSACEATPSTSLSDPKATLTLNGVQRAEHPDAGDGLLRYTFTPSTEPSIVLEQPALDANRGAIALRMQNMMGWAVTLVVDIQGSRPDQKLHAVIGVPAGPAQTLLVPLHPTSPRAEGMQAAPPMPYENAGERELVATTVEGQWKGGAIERLRISMPSPQAAQVVAFGRLHGEPGDALRSAYTGLVDVYGQYTRATWPEKIADDKALREGARQALAAAGGNQDKYGGTLAGATLKATGWFRTERRDGRWTLVTPEGHAFFSLGVNAVTPDGGRTYVQGREWMFQGLPAAKGEWTPFYGTGDNRNAEASSTQGIGYNHGQWFDFYAANLRRIDGDGWRNAWMQRTATRLRAWGFNTVGNWSDDILAKGQHLPYTRSINIGGVYGNVSSGYDYWGRMPDPFDPRFVAAAEAAVANATKDVRDDPWLLGYFADNELAWAGQGPDGRWGLAQGTLRGESRSDAKQRFIAVLKAKYGDVGKLAQAWGMPLASWDALNATGFQMPSPNEAHPAIVDDASAWLRTYADEYFRVVTEALHRHDPHHLFLGGRFAVNTPEAVASCAKYCDVISFNSYTDVPQHGVDTAAAGKLGKPVLITEFHFGSDDRGPFGKGVVSVWNEQQRGEAYARYVEAAAKDPSIVGAHWFQYTDQPVTGRLLDGENAHIGLVGITDIPFQSFTDAVRAANARALER